MNHNERTLKIDGVEIHLSRPDTTEPRWIGQTDLLKQILACWLVVSEKDLPLSPRIVGMPGIGKTTLAMAAALERKQPLYIFQCTSDTRPEDLLISPVLAESGKITYHASPLVSAMVTGGICILDEGNRMNEKSWASLAPLLDHRRYVESIIAGIQVRAHREFRSCVTMNSDESTFEIPDYILSRMQPTLKLDMPSFNDELAILKYHLPFVDDEFLNLTVEFLQRSHQFDLDFSPRDGLHILQYAVKRLRQDKSHPLAKDDYWREAVSKVLGEEALDLDELASRKRRALGGERMPMGLGDFFFSGDNPLHPDSDS
ncbi:MAG: AAA family ATPase [Candidatus Nitrohelix vancouverensis]|uniref:AAA family ATPase n=1 Tax=Candidatus Nitrohelix vancouverensis TaxID=2705534 RepID=A0A7T0C3Q5_9BACT|nr:MAG: AAA family ATPase [Candidatus Nitrohelix vancouverensis]